MSRLVGLSEKEKSKRRTEIEELFKNPDAVLVNNEEAESELEDEQ